MKTTIRYIMITVLLMAFIPMGCFGEESDKEIFDKARLSYLDKKYDQALNQLDRLIETFPHSSYYPKVLFYKGQCYIEKKMLQRALDNFEECLVVSENEILKQEAEISIIDMNFALYEKTGKDKYAEEIVRYLKSKNDVVRYYAAFILSKVKNKTIASKAVPILKQIIAQETDQELVNRAKLALLRIDPRYLQTKKPGSLVFQAINKKTKIETFLLKIPFALVSLAMDSLPKDAKEELKEEGYDLDAILKTVVEKGEILKIESEDSIFKIWIE